MGAKLNRPGRLADRDKTDVAAWDCPNSEPNANGKAETLSSFVLTLERAWKWWLDSGFPFGSPWLLQGYLENDLIAVRVVPLSCLDVSPVFGPSSWG